MVAQNAAAAGLRRTLSQIPSRSRTRIAAVLVRGAAPDWPQLSSSSIVRACFAVCTAPVDRTACRQRMRRRIGGHGQAPQAGAALQQERQMLFATKSRCPLLHRPPRLCAPFRAPLPERRTRSRPSMQQAPDRGIGRAAQRFISSMASPALHSLGVISRSGRGRHRLRGKCSQGRACRQ